MSLPPLTRRAFGAVSALSAAAVWAPAIGVRAQTDGAALGRVTVAVGGQGVLYHLPLALADALGYFRLEGLDVVVRDYSAGALAWQAVQDGAADVCSGAFEHVLRAQARGHAYRALVVQGRAPQLALGVSLRSVPAYKDLGDLAGRKVGVSSVGSSTHLAASLMLMRAGVPLREVSFVGVGSLRHRVVFYPITPPDPATGLATINWIAEITVDNQGGWQHGDWNRRVALEEFIHHFDGWNYSWLDVPAMLRGAKDIFEYPMIDRDPVPTWVDGRVALLGDAAHVMYPVGSNGASQAIVDARVLGAQLIAHGVGPQALRAYDDKLCKDISALVLRNRGSGPFGLLGLVDERCGGVFDHIDDVLPREEREGFMARYKAAAGFAIETLNAAPPTIAPGQRVAVG